MAMDELFLRRQLGNHLLQSFIPSMMLSVTSAASVYIPSDIVPGRMGLCVTSFLSLISLFNGARYVYSDSMILKSTTYFSLNQR